MVLPEGTLSLIRKRRTLYLRLIIEDFQDVLEGTVKTIKLANSVEMSKQTI